MNTLHIGSRREVCWDEELIDSCENVRVEMHKPEYRDDALVCDEPWEGGVCGYFTLLRDGTHYRLYYRGMDLDYDEFGNKISNGSSLCYAQSKDGKTFSRVNVGLHSYWGTKNNNILSTKTGDNISFFKDTNPACPPDELYKGLCSPGAGDGLWLFASSDGVNFEKKREIVNDGAYDSLNICFWDKASEQYFLYYRDFHDHPEKKGYLMRDVRMRTSKDFVNWGKPRMLEYGDSDPTLEMYTNNVQQYYRAPHMFIGMPTRYIDRADDPAGFPQLPDWKHRQMIMKYEEARSGTAMTDACLMTSRDGVNFRRTDEAFLTPGIERDNNWYYGECYLAYGMAETESDIPGAPNEISVFSQVDYRVKGVTLRRYAVRLDGFFSWRCGFKAGRVVTKPITFEGGSLSINFATSCAGYVRIRILSENGEVLEGYASGNHFGDSVDRCIGFDKPLGELAGKPVRLEITMRDADLYSFKFSD